MTTYFPNIPVIKYEGPKTKNPLAFRFYDADRVIAGRPMKDHLKFALSWWHSLCGDGSDAFGGATMDRSYGGLSDPLKIEKAKVDAGFEFMEKLGIEYFCFHDIDVVPTDKTFAETRENLLEIVDYIKGKMAQTNIKCLWGTSNYTRHPRFMQGASTSYNPDVFAWAAAKVKNTIDATIALGGQGYTFWSGRDGYDTLLNTNLELELDNMARLMKLARDYGRAKGFTGDFYIEPKPKEPTKHQYDFDVTTVLYFIHKYGLEKDFKLNVEVNHATMAGHTFQHELRVARINNALGSVDANDGDLFLGWDTDLFASNIYTTTLAMYEILKAGGFTNGGLNFDAKVRRSSFDFDDIVYGHILGMDTYALGLIKAQS